MLVFLRSSEITVDSKLERYSRALKNRGVGHTAIYWKGDAETPLSAQMDTICLDAPVNGAKRWKKALGLARFNLFALHEIWRRRHEISLIHAIDFDTALTGWIISRLTSIPFIYDVYDQYPDSRGITGPIKALIDNIEKLIMADAAQVVLADKARVQQHKSVPAARCSIMENVPGFSRAEMPLVSMPDTHGDMRLRVGYLGTFEPRYRGIENLIDAVEAMPNVELEIAGTGALDDLIKGAADRCSRIRYHGPVSHKTGLTLMQSCHVIAGLYYTDNPNHGFAAPNKYFEHLLLGRPLMTSSDTLPGQKVCHHNTGWAIADDGSAITDLFSEVLAHPTELTDRAENAARLWDDRYASYVDDVINGQYVDLVEQLSRSLPRHQAVQLAQRAA